MDHSAHSSASDRAPSTLGRPLRTVVHVLATAKPEGTSVARFVESLGDHAEGRGYKVAAWFLIDDGPRRDELAARGVDARFVPWRGRRDARGAAGAWRAARGARPLIVHRHTGGRSVGTLFRAATKARVIGHVHSTGSEVVAQRANAVLWGAHAVVANSEAAARACGQPAVRVIHPGVDVRRFACDRSGRPGEPTVLGTAGRLVEAKNMACLVAALAALRGSGIEAVLEIAGDGPERGPLARQAKARGVADHVRFLGWCDDVRSAFERWDVFVQCSNFEGFGLATLEAMASALPVVATAVGGVPELVEDGVTGTLVPPDDVAAFARALAGISQLGDRGRAMGLAGRARAARLFTEEEAARRTFDLYDELLSPTMAHAAERSQLLDR